MLTIYCVTMYFRYRLLTVNWVIQANRSERLRSDQSLNITHVSQNDAPVSLFTVISQLWKW